MDFNNQEKKEGLNEKRKPQCRGLHRVILSFFFRTKPNAFIVNCENGTNLNGGEFFESDASFISQK